MQGDIRIISLVSDHSGTTKQTNGRAVGLVIDSWTAGSIAAVWTTVAAPDNEIRRFTTQEISVNVVDVAVWRSDNALVGLNVEPG